MMRKRLQFVTIVLATTMAVMLVCWGAGSHLTAQQMDPPPFPAGEGPAMPAAGDQAPAAPENGPEVLTRGPVHEAFAEAINHSPEPGPAVGKQPPPVIEEMPPADKPPATAQGDYIWIAGYWAWDTERNDYIWVSGVWRLPPPGTSWVPGYWNQVANGYQWTSGYWGPATVTAHGQTVETEYLPQPPKSLEVGPPSPAPSEDVFWVPGCWRWAGYHYVWQPGHWGRAAPNWIWVPNHYVCTPAGYVFVAGHWDYSLDQRGVAFCPVYYANPYYIRPGYVYSPSICIEAGVLHGYLFCGPRWGHYYFGDYYDPGFAVSIGIFPCFDARLGWDPFYVHDRWYYRHDPMWDRHMHEDYAYRRDHIEGRPPRTYELAIRVGGHGGVTFGVGPVSARRGFERVPPERREQAMRSQREVRQAQADRRTMEVRAGKESGGRPTKPVHMSVATAGGSRLPAATRNDVRGTSTPGGARAAPAAGPATGRGVGPTAPPRPGQPAAASRGSSNGKGSSDPKKKDHPNG